MALPDLSHFRNPDPVQIVLVQTSTPDPEPDLGRPKRSPKKGKKQEISFFEKLKGTVSRDFLLQVFFMNHLPPSP